MLAIMIVYVLLMPGQAVQRVTLTPGFETMDDCYNAAKKLEDSFPNAVVATCRQQA